MIAKIILYVNNLVQFKVSGDEFIYWAKQIDRIAPDLDLKALQFLMDAFATEAIVYDHSKGIQNIFNGLKCVEKSEEGYKIIRRSWL